MKNSIILSMLCAVMVITSCGPDDPLDPTGTISLSIEANFDGETLMADQEFILPDGKKAKFSQFNFFISNASVNLVEDGSAKISDLTEVEFVELTQTSTNSLDPTDNTYQFFNMPIGDYSGIDFTLGLDDVLNDKSPSDQDLGDSSPLRKSSHYWAGWSSYIFMKLEGTIDFNEDGNLDGETENIVYHTGSENDGTPDDISAAQAISLPVIFTVTSDQTTQIKVSLDVKDILYDSAGSPNWDLEGRPTTHNPDDFDLVVEIMEKVAASFEMTE